MTSIKLLQKLSISELYLGKKIYILNQNQKIVPKRESEKKLKESPDLLRSSKNKGTRDKNLQNHQEIKIKGTAREEKKVLKKTREYPNKLR